MRKTRERICDAMLDLVSTQGYEATSIEQILERAEAGRRDFERLFSSKEDCAIAVFDRAWEEFNRQVNEAYEREAPWPDSLRAAAYAAARWIAENQRQARFGIVTLLWAGEVAQARREAAFQNFADMVDAGRERMEDGEKLPAFSAEGVIGSIAEMITKRAQRGEIEPYEYVPELMATAVRPYLGEEAAARELTIPPPRPAESD